MISSINNTVHLFQIALTPAFLLTGTAAILGILSSRLSGLLEKSRSLNQTLKGPNDEEFKGELALLDRCCILLYRAFVLCLFSCFFTCLVIGFIFAGQFLPDYVADGALVSILFTASLFCLTVSVLLLIYETILGKKLLFFVTKLGHETK
jgi:hypothetical protein